jgi:outer membrane receptor protein involved in Fe transport
MAHRRRVEFIVRATASTLAIALLQSPSPALAEDQAPNPGAGSAKGAASDTAVQEVVVTAQLRAQSLMQVPQAVQAVQGAVLERNGISDLKEAVSLVPGASMPAEISAGTETYQIRGVAAGQTIGDSTVGFYLDNFAFSIPGLPFAPSAGLYDVQRLEVLRGPSGTLYGQGSLGGTVKVLTNDPDPSQFSGSYLVSGSGTSGGGPNASADAMINVPLFDGTVAIRGVIGFDRLGGYVYIPHLNLKNANDSNNYNGRLKIFFTPNDKLKVLLSYFHDYVEQGFTNRMDSYNPPAANDTGLGNSPLEYSVYNGDIHYDLGFADFLSSTGYLYEHTGLLALGSQPAFGNYNITENSNAKSLQEELRLTSKSVGFFNWVVGGFYRDASYFNAQNFTVSIPSFTSLSNDTTYSKSWAVYGEGSLNLFGGKLVPTVGGRYFSDDRRLAENSENIVYGNPNVIQGPFIESDSGHNSAFSPRFNLAYHPSPDLTIYAEVAKGFRSGAIQGQAAVAALALLDVKAQTALGPDTLWNYEGGAKWRLFDRRLQLEVAGYYFDWSQAQLQYSPAGLSSIITAGDVDGRGVDLTANYVTPLHGLTLQVAGNLNSTTLTNVPAAVSAPLPWLGGGNQIPGAPRASGSVVVDYRHSLPNGWSWLFNGRYYYRGHQRDIVTGAQSAALDDGYIRIGVDTGPATIFLFCDNVSDDRGPASVDSGRYVIPYPRTVGVSVQGHF